MECKNQTLYYYNKTCVDIDKYCGLAQQTVFNETHCLNATGDPNNAEGVLDKITASEDYYKQDSIHDYIYMHKKKEDIYKRLDRRWSKIEIMKDSIS